MTNTQHIESAAITPEKARELARRIDNGYQMSKFAHMEDLRTEQKADSMRATDAIRSLADQAEALTKERDALARTKISDQAAYTSMRTERDAALALVAERMVDAENYQWLINNCGFGIRRNGVTELTIAFHKDQPDSIHDLGAAIRAARQAAKDSS